MNKKFLEVDEKQRQLEQEVQFERCMEFLVRMIEKYGDEIFEDLEESDKNVSEK